MKKVSYILLVVLLAVTSSNITAQDIHFSQFYASPLSLNPANTGNYDGDWRIMNNYRNQWRALSIPFRTISIGLDRQIWVHSEKFSAGFYVINDKSGPAGLTVNKIYLSVAWHKTINGHNLHTGIQGGMVFKKFSMDALTFPSQFDMTTGYFNNQMPANEDNTNLNATYPDLNFGIGWSKKLRLFEPEAGLSFFHLTMPKESFLENNNHLPIRAALNLVLNIPIKNWFAHPMILYMKQTRATDFLGGFEFGYNIPKSNFIKQIFAGYFFRKDFSTSFDASIAVIGLQYKQLRLGFSYDINSSPLIIATNRKGAFEVSLIYISKSTIPQKVTLPCDRL